MKFIIVNAANKSVRLEDHADMDGALALVGLKRGETDHGVLFPGIGYVVHEHGLFLSPELQHYWCFGAVLIGGNSVLYAFDFRGETEDATEAQHEQVKRLTEFFADAEAVERAISRGRILRPKMTLGDKVLWKWPQPKPEFVKR